MTLASQIKHAAEDAFKHLYPDVAIDRSMITVNQTKPEFKGDYTIVLFPFLKLLRQKPDAIGQQVGDFLVQKTELFSAYEIVAGFLNLTIKDSYWVSFLMNHFTDTQYGGKCKADCRVMVEYSSPNTNKPLHFGHLRNIFLGAAMSEILRTNGKQVVKANLINDRGIHICKSMIAWEKYANGATPESTGIKGDHLVGDYYVRFNDELKKEIAPVISEILVGKQVPGHFTDQDKEKTKKLIPEIEPSRLRVSEAAAQIDLAKVEQSGDEVSTYIKAACDENSSKTFKGVFKLIDERDDLTSDDKEKRKTALKKTLKDVLETERKKDELEDAVKELATNNSSLMREAQEMLRKWEAGDKHVRDLWTTMNGWVYKGFDVSYKKLGVSFDKMYYESDTYLLGKKIVDDGLKKGVLFRKENGSVWIDLKDDGLDEKLLLRGDGTSVYITQDLGTAKLKHDDYRLNQSIYVIADEQNYHIQVLQLIMKKLGEPCANGIYHLSYGMVELPTGKMKSREGTVVDADDMVDEMINLAKEQTEQSGKTEGFSQEELEKLYEMIGLGALKFYLLRVDPKKKMVFDPKESIDLHGFTATFIQYAHARICNILRKENLPIVPDCTKFQSFTQKSDLLPLEKKIMLALEEYPGVLEASAAEYNPSALCNYAFQLAQTFNSFYDAHSVSKAESEEKKQLRLMMIIMTASILRHSMHLLGIKMPEKM